MVVSAHSVHEITRHSSTVPRRWLQYLGTIIFRT